MDSKWMPIESAPIDGTPHVRGLWVTIKHEGKPDEKEWRYHAGYINGDGNFVDSEYGEDFGWEADWYDAWAQIPPTPSPAPPSPFPRRMRSER